VRRSRRIGCDPIQVLITARRKWRSWQEGRRKTIQRLFNGRPSDEADESEPRVVVRVHRHAEAHFVHPARCPRGRCISLAHDVRQHALAIPHAGARSGLSFHCQTAPKVDERFRVHLGTMSQRTRGRQPTRSSGARNPAESSGAMARGVSCPSIHAPSCGGAATNVAMDTGYEVTA